MAFSRQDHEPVRIHRIGNPERITTAADNQDRDARGAQFGRARPLRLAGLARRMQRESERDHGRRTGCPRGPAGQPGAVAAAALYQGQPGMITAQGADDLQPGRVLPVR
jgi:hypothetical protein